jgi:hypothetical protein
MILRNRWRARLGGLLWAVVLLFGGVASSLFAACTTAPQPKVKPALPPLPAPPEPLDEATILRKAEVHWLSGQHAKALGDLADLLRVFPDHLEGRILQAMVLRAHGQLKPSHEAWQRVERIIVVKGKRRAFTLQTTLLAAAEHYLAVHNVRSSERAQRRANLFVEELWRRFPGADSAARAQLMVALFASKARQWQRVQDACATLKRVQPAHKANALCSQLSLSARRLQRVGRLAPDSAPGWVWEAPLPQGNALNDVWVDRKGRQVVVGDVGTVMIREKPRGRFRVLPPLTRWNLRAVSGSSLDQLYIVGDGGLVLVLSAGKLKWVRRPQPLQHDLHGVWSARAGQLVAVGESGVVLRYRDGKWHSDHPTKHSLHAVWGTAEKNVYAAGDEGLMFHFNGRSWRSFKSDAYETLRAIYGLSQKHVLVAGDNKTIIYYNGTAAKESVQGLSSYLDIWAPHTRLAWAVGRGGTILRGGRNRLGDWVREPTRTMVELRGIAGRNANDITVVGQGGTILVRRGRKWSVASGGFPRR